MTVKLILILSVCVVLFAFASKKDTKTASAQASISGVIMDKSSNEKLAGVTIYLDVNRKVFSDAEGGFKLEGIEPGTYEVKITCISYKEQEVFVKIISRDQNEKLKIQLDPIVP